MRAREGAIAAKLAPNIFFHSLRVPKIGWMRTGYQGCIRAVRKKLKELRPEIVHGQGTEMDCAISAVFSGFPNVLTIHGNMRLIARVNRARPFSFLWLAARLERLTIPRSGGVVCITHYTRQAVTDLARRTWVVPNAVDASFFEVNARPAPGVPARMLCVGQRLRAKEPKRLYPRARLLGREAQIRAAVLRRRPTSATLTAGNSSAWSRRGPGAFTMDWPAGQSSRALLRQATVLVLPSLEDNCPMAVLEAMAAGVPVVASQVGGLPDLIEEGKTGFFCDPLEAASMAAAVEKVLVNPSAAAEVARQARQRARERFHPEVIARRHLEIYREVLSNRSPQGQPPDSCYQLVIILFDHSEPALLAHGGMLIQIRQTKAALEALGCQVEYLRWWDETQRANILHYFGRLPPT